MYLSIVEGYPCPLCYYTTLHNRTSPGLRIDPILWGINGQTTLASCNTTSCSCSNSKTVWSGLQPKSSSFRFLVRNELLTNLRAATVLTLDSCSRGLCSWLLVTVTDSTQVLPDRWGNKWVGSLPDTRWYQTSSVKGSSSYVIFLHSIHSTARFLW